MTEFLLCRGVRTADGSWVLSDSPTLAGLLIFKKGRGGGTPAACGFLSKWGYPSARGKNPAEGLGKLMVPPKLSQKATCGLILMLLENSKVASGC